MTKAKDITIFENKLLEFITDEDPLLSMLQWVTDKLVEVEVAQKVKAEKGKHTPSRATYRCGTRVRRFDTEACKGIIEYAFNKLNLTRLHAITEETNSKSIHILEQKLGFSFLSIKPIYGENMLLYELKKDGASGYRVENRGVC